MSPSILSPRGRSRPTKAFTLVELLLVVFVLAIATCLLLPALSRTESTSLRAACLSNKRSVSVAGLMFAADHRENLPPGGLANLSGTWLNDVPYATGDSFMLYGAELEALYEPSMSRKTQIRMWTSRQDFGLRRIGFALATKHSARLAPATEIVKTSSRIEVLEHGRPRTLSPMEMFWAADMTISEGDRVSGRSANNYARVRRKDVVHESAHLGPNGQPEGGYVVAVDGHVEWRRFDAMKLRTISNGPDLAAFWW